jgi:hypothetical protein
MAEAAKREKRPLDASWPKRPRDTDMTKLGVPGKFSQWDSVLADEELVALHSGFDSLSGVYLGRG